MGARLLDVIAIMINLPMFRLTLLTTGRPINRPAPASRPLLPRFTSIPQADRRRDLPQADRSGPLDSSLLFHKPTRRHALPQTDRLYAPLLIRGRLNSTFSSTSRPTTCGSCKSTNSQARLAPSAPQADPTTQLSRKPTASTPLLRFADDRI